MLSKSLLSLLLLLIYSSFAHAQSDQTDTMQAYLQQGKPEQAISIARLMLSNTSLNNRQRKALFEFILKAQLTIVKARHYEDVQPAIDTIKTLIQEFPTQINEPKLLWEIANLHWNQNNLEQTQADILDIQNRFPSSIEAKQSWLMLGKIHVIHKNYAEARNNFLRFAVLYPETSPQGYEVRMWTALIDYAEGRFDVALQTLNDIFNKKPTLITTQDSIYSRYIQLLHIKQKNEQALKQAKQFLAIYKTSIHTPEIRLLLADIQLLLSDTNRENIIKSYHLLANSEADTFIGKQAFMRKLMLQMENKKRYHDIKPAIIALKRIANKNQMSEVEDEAFLQEARLWHKVALTDPEHAPKQAVEAALQSFKLASKSKNHNLAKQAKIEGKQSFLTHIHKLIQQHAWNTATNIWQTFALFRPKLQQDKQLYFDIAHAFRLLYQYQPSESILEALQRSNSDSVWSDRATLELAKVWRDRQDSNGIQKIVRWLDSHEYNLYQHELRLVIAQIQLQSQQYNAASQTLETIPPQTLTATAKKTFWKTRALVHQALSRWHMAAEAWQTYATLNIPDRDQAKLFEANARFKAEEFVKAEKLYSNVPQSLRTPAWTYRYSISQLKNGKWNQAVKRLTELKNSPDAGIYTSMAALTLAERNANKLLENSL